MDYVFAPQITTVPIVGGGHFPVRRVYCVGRNYADHAAEMGFDARKEPPFFFCKSADNVVAAEAGRSVDIPYPTVTGNFHHEVELVVAIGGRVERGTPNPLQHVFGHAIGLDMTRRDLQMKMRDSGRPWEIGKVVDGGAPISPIYPIGRTGKILAGRIELAVDGVVRQKSDVEKMIWSTSEIIAELSRYYVLEPGDLIFTGTPEGVGPVVAGQVMVARIEGLGELSVKVIAGAA